MTVGQNRSRSARLLVYSAPVAVVTVLIIVKLLSLVVAGRSVASDYADRDAGAMAGDIAVLRLFNVVEPAKVHVADGARAVLENRLTDAERQYSEALTHTDAADSCPVRVDLELVRETLGDRAASRFDTPAAIEFYEAARDVVTRAPQGCFAGNDDTDPHRRALREEAAARLDDKLAAMRTAAPPPPPPPPAAAPVPSSPGADGAPPDADTRNRLNPGSGDPLERLQQILRDAAG
ncbi:hypothetical protein KL953_01425 [Mycolicibacterium goodii]|uniref:hypothetical protein n=1 Tax=Mycolicibacterium goodii TaxID=134601 RepID=UPI001BDD3889|nr:hypothetical protein [Mycolicibacterium goodii]MBU8807549.1 hypothetical protein [Mycolicibacterium goodii]